MKIPDLRLSSNEIELDKITILVETIQRAWPDVYSLAPDVEGWDVVEMRDVLKELLTPREFDGLFATEFGKGVIVGMYLTEYLKNLDEGVSLEDIW